jgi:hypothetical protein
VSWDERIKSAGLEGKVKMIRRDEAQPGDELLSSHYGRRTVKSATQYGDEGQTTEIVFESPEGARIMNERYGSDQMIPKVMPAALIVTTRHSRCSYCNELVDTAIQMSRVAEIGALAYNHQGHGVAVEHETYEQRRAALEG